MIVIVDPSFIARPDLPLTEDEMQLLGHVNLMCRRQVWSIPRLHEYWDAMWAQFGRQFETSSNPRVRQIVKELRENSSDDRDLGTLSDAKVWRRGFAQLFGPLGYGWEDRMAQAIARAVGLDSEVILLTRKIQGRNVIRHAAEDTVLDEVTRWILYVQPKRVGAKSVNCVHHRRNLVAKWSARFDWRLPTDDDGAKYPFCVPHRWWRHTTMACRTIEGKPAWLDSKGNGWARPNILDGKGYHWDVFIRNQKDAQRVGVQQVNVVEYGSQEGRAGTLHHVPGQKRSRAKDVGWSCD